MTANSSQSLVLARRHHEAGRLADAEQLYRQIIGEEPHNAAALQLLGVLAVQTGRHAEAIELFEKAVAANPSDIGARRNLGSAYSAVGRFDEGRAALEVVARLAPTDPDAHYNLGLALWHLGRLEEAVAACQRTLQLNPAHCAAERNLGVALHRLGRMTQAEHHLLRARELEPGSAASHVNLGTVLKDQLRLDEAIACYNRAIDIEPDNAQALLSRGTTLLTLRQFAAGWRDYEHRARCPDSNTLRPLAPLWDGSPLGGRTLLVHSEQGLGDTLQFMRYVRVVESYGGNVITAVQPALLPLLAESGFKGLVSRNDPLPRCDVHMPLLSLPGLFGTDLATIPADVPYLKASPDRIPRWRNELTRYDDFKIGIAWQGQPKFRDDRLRSIPLEQFAPLSQIDGVRLFSLQKGPGCEQLAALGGRFPVVDLGTRLDNDGGAFLDTAAVMQSLDLVVTSDTAIAHLAGALGIEVWVVLTLASDWRWMLDCSDSPWYPTMRLFRQPTAGNWSAVFCEIAGALASRM